MVDETDTEEQREQAEIGFQAVAARLSRILGAAAPDTLDVAVEECLALTAEATDVDVAFAVLVDPSECVTDDWNWVRPGLDVHGPPEGSPLHETFGSVVEILRIGQTVAVDDLAGIELSPSERALAASNDLRALLIAPVRIGSTLLGVTGLQVIGRPWPWSREVVEYCDLVAQLLVQAVRRTRDRGALAAMDERARRIAEFIPDGLLLLDSNGGVNWASPSFLRSSGRQDVLSGLPAVELVHPAERATFLEAIEADPLGGTGLVVRVQVAEGWRWNDVSWQLVHADDAAVPDELVVSLRDIHETHLRAQELLRESTCDALTGLLNRAGLTRVVAGLKQSREDVVVAFVDIDEFKAINDSGGHAAGDAVLERIAGALASSVRETDSVARVGGDEFCVVTSADTPAEVLAQRILAAVREASDAAEPPATVSIGVAGPGPAHDVVGLQRRADDAMYRVKRAGGDGASLSTSR